MNNMNLYDIYNKQLTDLRNKKAQLMSLIKSVRRLIRKGRTELNKKAMAKIKKNRCGVGCATPIPDQLIDCITGQARLAVVF